MDHNIYNSPSPKVALMQPTFLPWLGYFGLIHSSDVFVFLDDFQFSRQSYGHRNSLLINNQKTLITLPVSREASHKESYAASEVKLTEKFVKKTLRSIEQNYSFSQWLEPVLEYLETSFNTAPSSVAEFNISFIRWACNFCQIKSNFKRSSQINKNVSGDRSDRVLNILRYYEARTYLSARGSFEYMYEDKVFPTDDIVLLFQNYKPIVYEQHKQNEFVSHLSILDAILQIGPIETKNNIEKSSENFKTWNEMLKNNECIL